MSIPANPNDTPAAEQPAVAVSLAGEGSLPGGPPSLDGPVLAVPVGPPSRPVGLTIACVIAVVFGALCLLQSLSGLTALLVGSFLSGSGPPANLASDPQLQAQWEMHQALMAAGEPYFWFGVAQLLMNLLLGFTMLLGGVTTLSNQDSGRRLLIRVFRIAAIYIVLWGMFYTYQQLQIMPVIQIQFEKLTMTIKNLPPQTAEIIRIAALVTFYATLVIMLGIGFAQIIAYTLSANYLASDAVAALFQTPNESSDAVLPPSLEPARDE